MFWQGGQAVYRPAGGYARIATIVKQIRAANQGRTLFCDCGDTLHGTYPALETQGQALIPILNSLGLDAMTAHWEFAYGPATFKQRAMGLSYPRDRALAWQSDGPSRELQAITKVAKGTDGDGGA